MSDAAFPLFEGLESRAVIHTRQVTPGAALERARARLMLTLGVFLMAFAAVAVKLVDATVIDGGHEPSLGQAAAQGDAPTGRADIVDRNGIVLATSLQTYSIYADPKVAIEPRRTAEKLASVLKDLHVDDLAQKLASDKRFVWIKRNIAPRQYQEIHRLGLPGIYAQREERRLYPNGHEVAHVLGFSGVDNSGLAGVEQKFDQRLKESADPLQLSIDIRLQHILKRELQTAISDFTAIGGAGMIYDVRTGEVLAMVSLPDFDPQNPTDIEEEARFNRNTLGVYEMGSTFKIFNSAMALDSGAVGVFESFDATQPIHYGRFTINDYHGQHRWLTVPEIFMHSSNIGSVRMALKAGVNTQKSYLGKLGLLNPSPVELPEVGAPMVPHPWRDINAMTIAFGHGISVSAMQLVAATGAVINGGTMVPPTLLKRDLSEGIPGEPVLNAKTSQTMRKLMRVVVTQGTAKAASAPGYVVGGKTGTAEKSAGRHYSQNARLSSFVGGFPMHDPRYIIFIMVDEPKANAHSQGYATGGWVAAPAVGRIVRQIGPLLGVPMVDENAPEIRRALDLDSHGTGGGSLPRTLPVNKVVPAPAPGQPAAPTVANRVASLSVPAGGR